VISNIKDLQVEIIVATDYEDEYLKSISEKFGIRVVLCGEPLGEKIISGIKIASSDIVVFLEDDDIFLPGKLERICRIFNKIPNIGYYHNQPVSSLSASAEPNISSGKYEGLVVYNSSDFKKTNRSGSDYNMSSIAISKNLGNSILKIVGNRTDLLSISPDTFIFLCAIFDGVTLAVDKEPLTLVSQQDSLSFVSPNRTLEEFVNLSISNLSKFIKEYTKFFEFFPSRIVRQLIFFKLIQARITLSILKGEKIRSKYSDLIQYLIYNAIFLPYGDAAKHILYLTLLAVLPTSISTPVYRKRYFRYMKLRSTDI
jgi:glycosyltransferase involved in cell wall biosynthesis